MQKKIKARNNFKLTTCALCQSSTDLRNSHIVPKFAFDWLKRTSGTGYLRLGSNVNKREQDGFKERMLCGDCEQLFSNWEGPAASNIFGPVHDDQIELEYGDWFYQFAKSVCWRILFTYRQIGLSSFPEKMIHRIDDTIENWRQELLANDSTDNTTEFHCFTLGPIEQTDFTNLPPSINRYFLRAIDTDVIHNSTDVMVYAKLARLVIIGTLQRSADKEWVNTQICPSGDTLKRHVEMSGDIGEFLIHKAGEYHSLINSFSNKQMNKLSDAMMADVDKTANSASFGAMYHDVQLFGRDAFAPPDSAE